MEYPRLKKQDTGKLFFCCFLTLFLCLTLSSFGMALDVWDYANWNYTYPVEPWAVNLTYPVEPMAPQQGRLGIQSQAPEGVQVMPARDIYVLYNFWTMALPDYWKYLRPERQSAQIISNPVSDKIFWFPYASSRSIFPISLNNAVWQSTAAGMGSGGGMTYWFPGFLAAGSNP